jgi:2-C-methyl-D-erythritol 4-phosphate cytidylyltransferase
VGVVNDFRSSVTEKTDVIWMGANALAAVGDLVTDTHITGDTVRGTVQSANLDRLLEKLRANRARLISVIPIQRTLEDYFLSKTTEQEDKKEVVRS